MARHLELAAKARAADDLASAAEHEQVLVLLAPDDPQRRKALDATRNAIRNRVREHGQAGLAARRSGDLAAARDAYLRVLALDPGNDAAATALREIELAAMSRAQSDRAARARATEGVIAGARARAAGDSYDLEQRIELFRAGDLNAGLRELRAWVDANPADSAGRQRVATLVAERARDLDANGQRETALALYEQATAFAGGTAPEWSARMQALRKALGEHYYVQGMKVYRTDVAAAVRQFETGVRYDPSNITLQTRLREAKLAQEKLQKIGAK